MPREGLNRIPCGVLDEQALLVGDVLAKGFWAARISEITPEDTVLIIGAGPTGICTLLCVMLPLPDMYGKNLTFKTGGVDGCDSEEVLHLIEEGRIDTTPLITHRFPLSKIEEAYRIFENKLDGVIKVAII